MGGEGRALYWRSGPQFCTEEARALNNGSQGWGSVRGGGGAGLRHCMQEPPSPVDRMTDRQT